MCTGIIVTWSGHVRKSNPEKLEVEINPSNNDKLWSLICWFSDEGKKLSNLYILTS